MQFTSSCEERNLEQAASDSHLSQAKPHLPQKLILIFLSFIDLINNMQGGLIDIGLISVDLGSQHLRAGWASTFTNENEPRLLQPSYVIDQSEESYVHLPVIEEGRISNFNGLENLLHACFYAGLGWTPGQEGYLVIAEPMGTPKIDREKLVQMAFEKFNVTGLYCQDQATLALYAAGKLNGCVVDLGHGKLDVTSVHDGLISLGSSHRLTHFGGAELSSTMRGLMKGRVPPSPSPPALMDSAADWLKEQCAQACLSSSEYDRVMAAAAAGPSSSTSESSASLPGSSTSYKLPDGQEVAVTTEGIQLVEGLFRPETSILSPSPLSQSPSLQEVVMASTGMKLEGPNVTRHALENILICGGGSLIPNFSQRLLAELKALSSPGVQPSLCPLPEYFPSPQAQRNASWVGACIAGRVVQSNGHFMSKGDYEEGGPAAVWRRCD
jgi:actin-related protein 7